MLRGITHYPQSTRRPWHFQSVMPPCRLRVQLAPTKRNQRDASHRADTRNALPQPHAASILSAPGVSEWQVIIVCAAMTPLVAQMLNNRTSELESLSGFLGQITHYIALPCYTFTLGATYINSTQSLTGAFIGVLRAAVGALLGLSAAIFLEQVCQRRVPLLSAFLLSGSGSSSQRSIAETAARAFGSPQAASTLLSPRVLVPPGLRLALTLACAFPAALTPLRATLEPATTDFVQGSCLGLVLCMWLVARSMLLWNRGQQLVTRATDSSSWPASPLQPLHTWMRLQGNQEVLMPEQPQDKTSTSSSSTSSWSQQAEKPVTASTLGSGEIIEAVVTDLDGSGSGPGRLQEDRSKAGGLGQGLGGRAARWAVDDRAGGSLSWTEKLVQAAAAQAAASLPAVALIAGLAAGQLLRLAPDSSQLPWDGTLLSMLGGSLVQAVGGLAPALQLLLLLNMACLCTAVDESSPTPITAGGVNVTAPSGWTRLQCLLFPSQPLDILLLVMALLGVFLAWTVANQAIGQLAALGILAAPVVCLQGIHPDMAMLALVQMTGSRGRLEGMQGDSVRQLAVLLFRMIMWGPALSWVVGLLALEGQAALLTLSDHFMTVFT